MKDVLRSGSAVKRACSYVRRPRARTCPPCEAQGGGAPVVQPWDGADIGRPARFEGKAALAAEILAGFLLPPGAVPLVCLSPAPTGAASCEGHRG